ncbi:unnamed protein product [Chrysoparadoxa australica]
MPWNGVLGWILLLEACLLLLSVATLAAPGGQVRSNPRKYDGSVVTYDPNGSVFQVEYALEATKRGSSIVGGCSKECAVLASWAKPAGVKAYPPKPIKKLHSHLGLAASGLSSDVEFLSNEARQWCREHRYIWGTTIPPSRLSRKLADAVHACTCQSGQRPMAVDVLVAGSGNGSDPALIRILPTGSMHRCRLAAAGANAGSAIKYLVSTMESLTEDESEAEMVGHVLRALREAACSGGRDDGLGPLKPEQVTIAIFRRDEPLEFCSQEEVASLLAELEEKLQAESGE